MTIVAVKQVTPRPGAISPWSSKATDIAHNCGLQHVRRIERGVAYPLPSPLPNRRTSAASLISPGCRLTRPYLSSFIGLIRAKKRYLINYATLAIF